RAETFRRALRRCRARRSPHGGAIAGERAFACALRRAGRGDGRARSLRPRLRRGDLRRSARRRSRAPRAARSADPPPDRRSRREARRGRRRVGASGRARPRPRACGPRRAPGPAGTTADREPARRWRPGRRPARDPRERVRAPAPGRPRGRWRGPGEDPRAGPRRPTRPARRPRPRGRVPRGPSASREAPTRGGRCPLSRGKGSMGARLRKETGSGYHAPWMNLRAVGTPVGLLSLLSLAWSAGCRGCHDDHPYVPYAIASAAPHGEALDEAGASLADASPASEGGVDPFSGEPALVAPPSLSQWAVDGVPVTAPDGQVFVLGLARDFDGDGTKDVFAIVRPADGNDPGRVVFYRGAPGAAPLTFDPPANLAQDPSCTAVARLVGIGADSVLAELGQQCPVHPSSAPVRWVAVLAGGATPRVRLAATLADPAGAPALSVDADGADRDADGREDIALRVTIEGGGAPLEPGPRVSATIAWLDRPAGLSRDAGATESSFTALASSAAAHAARSKEAPAIPGYVPQVRALWRAMCSEGGAPRIVAVAGAGTLGCSSGHALETLGLAAVRAYAVLGGPPPAGRAGWRPWGRPRCGAIPFARRGRWIARSVRRPRERRREPPRRRAG